MSTITTQAGRAVKASRLRWRGAGRTTHKSQNPISHTRHTPKPRMPQPPRPHPRS